jgi:CRISPR-associated protein Cas2
MRADILVCYDVNTQDAAGRRRLRQVAKTCTSYGQRVQLSVFECTVNEVQMLTLRKRLLGIIQTDCDSLRIYHLHGDRSAYLEAFGRDRYVDFDEPLVF